MSESASIATIKVADIKTIVEAAPQALTINTNKVTAAVAALQKLLEKVRTSEMTAELDAECMKMIAKVRTTRNDINLRRKPLTQLFDDLRNVFTGLENQIDDKAALMQELMIFRNNYVKKLAADEKKRQDEIALTTQKQQERIKLMSDLWIQLRNYFLSHLSSQNQAMLDLFNGLTLDNIATDSHTIAAFNLNYEREHFLKFKYAPTFRTVLEQQDKIDIWNEVSAGKFEEFQKEFTEVLTDYRDELKDKVPGKRKELEAIADANEKEKKRLQEEQKQREEAAQAELNKKSTEAVTNAAEIVKMNEEVATTQNLFEAESQKASPTFTAPPSKASLKINVLKAAGYMPIIATYFTKEGNGKDPIELEKKTFLQCKTFCEKLANGKENFKIESPFLEYVEDVKAINKR